MKGASGKGKQKGQFRPSFKGKGKGKSRKGFPRYGKGYGWNYPKGKSKGKGKKGVWFNKQNRAKIDLEEGIPDESSSSRNRGVFPAAS